MKTSTTALLVIITALLVIGHDTGYATSAADVPERWHFRFDTRKWHLGHQAANRQQAIREYVLSGQTVQDWSELVTSVYVAGRVSPSALLKQFRRDISRGCPSLRVSVIDESGDTILFEWQHDGCQGYPAQHELRRITRSKTGTLTLSFVEKTKQLSAEKRAAWISLLRAANVRPDA